MENYSIRNGEFFYSREDISTYFFPKKDNFIHLFPKQWPIRRSLSRKMYLELPFPLVFNAFIFNILNPEEVQNGGKPHLEEIGPYVFQWVKINSSVEIQSRKVHFFHNFFFRDYFSQYVLKHDAIDDKKNDTLTFTLKKTWMFKPDLSNGLTGDEIVTILHPGIKCLRVLGVLLIALAMILCTLINWFNDDLLSNKRYGLNYKCQSKAVTADGIGCN